MRVSPSELLKCGHEQRITIRDEHIMSIADNVFAGAPNELFQGIHRTRLRNEGRADWSRLACKLLQTKDLFLRTVLISAYGMRPGVQQIPIGPHERQEGDLQELGVAFIEAHQR